MVRAFYQWRALATRLIGLRCSTSYPPRELLAGLDPTGDGGAIAGSGDQREVELLIEAGLTPVQAIRIATLNGACFLGQDWLIGSIEPGKAADLMLLKGNPVTNFRDIDNIELVFKDGVVCDAAVLFKAANGTVRLR